MKIIFLFFSIFYIFFLKQNETSFTGSTPAGKDIRSFLGIPLSDSVDFIRWKIILWDHQYEMDCHYGIGKPNTNGFIQDGERKTIRGNYRKEGNIYFFMNDMKILKALAPDVNLLHIMDAQNNLYVGNGGWSYTLNNLHPIQAEYNSVFKKPYSFKDSLDLEGRTPCGVPGIIEKGKVCYKLKWHMVLYKKPGSADVGNYKITGTAWRDRGSVQGTWKIVSGKSGETIFQLYNEKAVVFLRLTWVDTGIFVFTDTSGHLLVGNEDFSYTLNRRH